MKDQRKTLYYEGEFERKRDLRVKETYLGKLVES